MSEATQRGAGGRRAGYAGGPVTGFAGHPPIARNHGTVRSKGKEEDWTVLDALQQGLLRPEFPANVDLRENDWYDIVCQGDSSSCVAWASSDSLLRWHFVKAGRMEKNQFLSARFTWMAAKETDKYRVYPETFLENAGTPLKAALHVLKKYGCVLEDDFPFNNSTVRGINTAEFYAKAAQYRLASYYSMILDEKPNLDHLRMWISQQGPIMVMSDLDSSFKNLYQGKKDLEVYDKASVIVDDGHAFALVGYTPEYFIIRNTWGLEWGDQGHAYATNDYIKAALCEGYGLCI
jgi:C1A family cysteine protease